MLNDLLSSGRFGSRFTTRLRQHAACALRPTAVLATHTRRTQQRSNGASRHCLGCVRRGTIRCRIVLQRLCEEQRSLHRLLSPPAGAAPQHCCELTVAATGWRVPACLRLAWDSCVAWVALLAVSRPASGLRLRPRGCGRHAVCRSCAEPRFGLAGEPGAWEAFEAVLRSPLPVAFRFTGWDAAALHPAPK